jgi:hypothetical protein
MPSVFFLLVSGKAKSMFTRSSILFFGFLGVGKFFMSELPAPNTPTLDSLLDSKSPSSVQPLDPTTKVPPLKTLLRPEKKENAVAIPESKQTSIETAETAANKVIPATAHSTHKSPEITLPTTAPARELGPGLLACFQLPCCGTASLLMTPSGSFYLHLAHKRRTFNQAVPVTTTPKATSQMICLLGDDLTELWANDAMTVFEIVRH